MGRHEQDGLVLCGMYAVVIAACLGFAFFGSTDPKGNYVVLQLPIVVQFSIVERLGLAPLLHDIGWPVGYLLLAGPVFVLLYGIGALQDRLNRLDL